jgi:hypothetical protein
LGQLVDEVNVWKTPTVGAYLIWRFTDGYCKGHPESEAPIALLHFLAIAIVTNKKLIAPISNKRKDLQSYINSFEQAKDSDLLLSVQDRIRDKLEYTLASIDMAIAQGIIAWDVVSGKIYSKDLIKKEKHETKLSGIIKKDGDKAEILGKWFSKHDLLTIAAYFKVVF